MCAPWRVLEDRLGGFHLAFDRERGTLVSGAVAVSAYMKKQRTRGVSEAVAREARVGGAGDLYYRLGGAAELALSAGWPVGIELVESLLPVASQPSIPTLYPNPLSQHRSEPAWSALGASASDMAPLCRCPCQHSRVHSRFSNHV
jgi:hypothetical protein